jgi:hypothetical protein
VDQSDILLIIRWLKPTAKDSALNWQYCGSEGYPANYPLAEANGKG